MFLVIPPRKSGEKCVATELRGRNVNFRNAPHSPLCMGLSVKVVPGSVGQCQWGCPW